MKYEIMMSCGHEDTVELFGKEKERDRKIEYLKIHGLCKECYRKKKKKRRKKKGLFLMQQCCHTSMKKMGVFCYLCGSVVIQNHIKMKLNRWEIIAGVKGNRQTIGILFSFRHYVGIKS